MALTYQERANFVKGLSIPELSITPVTPMEKIDACLKKLAADILSGALLPADIPYFLVFNPTASMINEWCNRILDNTGLSNRMVPMVIGHAQWDTDGVDNITDTAIRNTCLNCIAAHASKL